MRVTRRLTICAALIVPLMAIGATAVAGAQDTSTTSPARSLPTGATITVMQGTPATGPSTMRMELPDGYIIATHRHPTDEMVTVISGTYIIKYGAVATTISAGQSSTIKAKQWHNEQAEGPTVVEVQYAGPFAIKYAGKRAPSISP
jgi:quercetin dioxygenase-like cupin family protein